MYRAIGRLRASESYRVAAPLDRPTFHIAFTYSCLGRSTCLPITRMPVVALPIGVFRVKMYPGIHDFNSGLYMHAINYYYQGPYGYASSWGVCANAINPIRCSRHSVTLTAVMLH